MSDALQPLFKTLGYQFKDTTLLVQALTHRSLQGENNERLEFLGDSIVNFVVADLLYKDKRRAQEGDLSRFRAALVNRDGLAELAAQFKLSDYLRMGTGELQSGGYLRPSILSDTLEAIVAAIYLDSDMATCYNVISAWFIPRIASIESINDLKDSKTQLQEYAQARKLKLPEYELTHSEGRQHQQTFHVTCVIAELNISGQGTGESRRKAEQAAAQHCLEQLKHD
ncbi:MAG: ribonuclease III [Gammaproteobacteria bacterium]|nr:ribonuclease III [Gammaproteobacteria bacterium]